MCNSQREITEFILVSEGEKSSVLETDWKTVRIAFEVFLSMTIES